jgi:transcriptional regulator with XRE-family HTH domain
VHEGEAMIEKRRRALVEPLSARVFRLRIARGYSINELAQAADIWAGTVRRLESHKPVDKHVLPALAIALGVPLCRLVCGEHDCAARACVPSNRLRRAAGGSDDRAPPLFYARPLAFIAIGSSIRRGRMSR